ncbi:ABC transporter substrate-binding protein (plasmid) [Pseudomonas silvicola]|nr:ABC transporter substrate-binding protein [Pseudomonas silvicola]
MNQRGEPIPALAKSWQVSEDGLRWQLQLRDNVHFHDGSPLDAAAVVKSLNTARSKVKRDYWIKHRSLRSAEKGRW